MTEEKYNGWTNRETWAFKLHLDENYDSVAYWENYVVKKDVFETGEALKDYLESIYLIVLVEGRGNEAQRRMVEDIGSKWRINYAEVARAFKGRDDDE